MCNCKSSLNKVTTVKQVVKKVKVVSNPKSTMPQRSVSKKVSYRRPI